MFSNMNVDLRCLIAQLITLRDLGIINSLKTKILIDQIRRVDPANLCLDTRLILKDFTVELNAIKNSPSRLIDLNLPLQLAMIYARLQKWKTECSPDSPQQTGEQQTLLDLYDQEIRILSQIDDLQSIPQQNLSP